MTQTLNAGKTDKVTKPASIIEVLIDLTDWLGSFAREAMELFPASQVVLDLVPPPRAGPAQLIQAEGFPQNFYPRYMTQGSSGKPVKSAADRTIYYAVAFCALPADPMIPRPKDRRVGFFETSIIVGGANKVNEKYSVIDHGIYSVMGAMSTTLLILMCRHSTTQPSSRV